MFIESNVKVEGQVLRALLERVNVVIKNIQGHQNMLPISTSNNIKCLDFDVDNVVFRPAPKSPVKLAEVNPYNKSMLEVMDMV